MPSFQKLMYGALEKIAKRQAEMDALQVAARKEAELAAAAKAKFADPAVAPPGPLTLYHGSPHKFEEFDFENNLKKGEGALAFGPGGYMTGHRPLAEQYARNLYQKHAMRGKETSHQGIATAAKMDPVATAEFLRAKQVANLRPQIGALNAKGWDLVVPPPYSPLRSLALANAEPAWTGGPTYPKSLPALVARSSPDLERYADIVGNKGQMLMNARIGRGGVDPKDAVEMGRELRSILAKHPDVRPRLQERLTFDPNDPMIKSGGVWSGSMTSREEIGRRNASLGMGPWGPPRVSGYNPRRANLNSTARVIEGRPGNSNYWASMDPNGRGRIDLRDPPAPNKELDIARRVYSAPLGATWADMLPYDYPLETVTPKLMGALTQLAAQHGDLDLLRPRMTGEEFINHLRGPPLDKMRMLKDAGIPATFFLRGGRRGQLPDRLDPSDFNFVIHDQTRLGKPEYDEFAKGGAV